MREWVQSLSPHLSLISDAIQANYVIFARLWHLLQIINQHTSINLNESRRHGHHLLCGPRCHVLFGVV